jgi:hypothetical protein
MPQLYELEQSLAQLQGGPEAQELLRLRMCVAVYCRARRLTRGRLNSQLLKRASSHHQPQDPVLVYSEPATCCGALSNTEGHA